MAAINGIYKPFLDNLIRSNQMRVHVKVTEEARVDEKPEKGPSEVWSIKTKPYPLTLNAQKDNATCKWWWQNLRPLLIQTAALGPSEFLRAPERQPDFRVCRLITVAADTIEKIQYVTHDAMKAGRWDHLGDVTGPILTGGGRWETQ